MVSHIGLWKNLLREEIEAESLKTSKHQLNTMAINPQSETTLHCEKKGLDGFTVLLHVL